MLEVLRVQTSKYDSWQWKKILPVQFNLNFEFTVGQGDLSWEMSRQIGTKTLSWGWIMGFNRQGGK